MRSISKKGFTLVELIIVLVIVGILAAVGIPTASHFIKLAEFRKNEENARTAYLAAEAALAWYRSSGEWESFCRKVTEKGTLNDTFAADDDKSGRIYSVTIENGQPYSASGVLAMELLDKNVYSKDFFNAAIAIEIDVKTGQVYSAFYGTRCSSLSYSGTDENGELNISAADDNRSYDNRRGRLLGYYSVEDVTNVVELKPVRLKVTTINLVNSETLSLNWTSNSRHDNLDVKFLISFYQKDSNGDRELFSTEVDWKNLVKTGEKGSQTVSLALKTPQSDGGSRDIGNWTFPLSYQTQGRSGGRFSLVLDGMMTAELMESIKAKENESPAAGVGIARQYSTGITRLGGEIAALKEPVDIYAQIEVEATYAITGGEFIEYTPGGAVKSNVENTLYGKSEEKGGSFSAEISRFRHLSNIRYYDADKKAEFTLNAGNLDWTAAGVGVYGLSAAVPGEGGGEALRTLVFTGSRNGDEVLDFPSVELLSENHTLSGRGASTVISNLSLGEASMPGDDQIKALYPAGAESHRTKYLGLFCETEGTIKGITLSNPILTLGNIAEDAEGVPETKAAENFASLYGAGILSGRNQGTLEDISVKTSRKDSPVVAVCLKNREQKKEDAPDDKPAAIGGLVGVLAGKKDDGTLEALTDAGVKISGLTMEGSIMGILPAPYAEASLNVQAEGGMASAFRAAEEKSPEQRATEYSYGIGGIFGYGWLGERAGKRVQIENSQNHAGITGNLFTGGICGYLRDDFDTALTENTQEQDGSIVNCENDGLILCSAEMKEEDNALEGRYFGGILGFGDKVRVNDSTSASGRAKNYRYTFDQKEQVLLGQYVGGIIGYGNSSRIAGCKTEKGGYVLGSDYVGGIAGGLSNDAREAITGTAGIAVTTNAGYVIGNRYVGGIVGKNDGEQETTITNCVNNGVAAGYDCFIGGIAGYNGENGRLLDCASYLSDYNGELLATITDKWQATGDCAGGLVGYNNGKIEFTEESEKITVKSVSGIVVGRDYVGGVIGFNDDKGTLDVNYTLIGGRIYAFGNGAGGCIGLNASTEILGKELSIRPSEVTGNYYVGGCIGANVVDLTAEDGSGEEKTQDIVMEGFRADNTLGSITGRAFTGGVIGYQRTYKKEQLKNEDGETVALPVYLDMTGKREDGADFDSSGAAGENLLPLLPGLDGQNVPTKVLPSENTFTLTIGNDRNTSAQLTDDNNNIPVYSDLYVGGIVGYCERNSKLVIVNCKNSGRLSKYGGKEGSGTEDGSGAENSSGTEKAAGNVSLQAYLESGEVNADISELEAEDIRVSVGGGIIGANLDNQIIDHCVNTGTMNGFIGLGGIVGFNAGGVFNCELSDNFGNAGLSYIGGIVGLNVKAGARGADGENNTGTSADGLETGGKGGKVRLYRDTLNREWSYTSGMVARCLTRENRNISGNSCVGGIAGFNLSGAVLEANENRANVMAAGNYAGGIAGINSGNILTASGSQAQGDIEDITISGDAGEGIGGIAGWNKNTGSISVYAGADETKAEPEVVAVGSNVTVSGREKVGGIVGINEGVLDTFQSDGSIRFLVCKAKLVHAADDYAGGIIGEARAGNKEAGVQSKKILRAVNKSADVTADNGRAGGIVAVNAEGFALEECKNIGNVNSDHGYAGGIAAENFGEIINCSVGDESGAKEVLIRSQGADAIGAVCAVNYGQIRDSAPVRDITAGTAEVILSGTADMIGGIAGKNAAGGVIGKTCQSGFEVTYMPKLDISVGQLTVGGIAGLNEGGALGGGDEPGDAAGTDGKPESREARIEEITVRGLSFEDFKNYRYLGGIAGENKGGARVKDCIADNVKIEQKSGSEAGNCYGGIAGRNSGILEDSGIKEIDLNIQGVYTAVSTSTAEEKERLSAHIGGIAGKNEESGRIIGCLIENTGKKENIIHAQSGMAGGIAGYNKGSIEMSGDKVTERLMQDDASDGGGNVRINDVQELIANAQNAGIRADGNYVAWSSGILENQRYAGGSGKVSDGRSLSLIVTANGNLGGITAYNAPSGRVNYCATGNWYLNNKSQAIGVGTGGVIGMNESGQKLSFLLNQAFVGRELSGGDTNRFAGGIIGNQNNSTGSGWVIQGCVNYGTVYCRNTHYSGGIMGQWTSSGGTIEKCYNYGNLQTTYQAGWVGAAAGIVAQLYHACENNEYNILSCGNYGNIYGRNGRDIADCANDSAGILGNVTAYRTGNSASAQNYAINVTDCVNGAGVEIYSGSMASGIVGFFSCDSPDAGGIATSTANIALNIERCRNYAAVLKGQQFVAGIFGDRYGEAGSAKTSLKYCFSVNRQNSNYNKADYPVISYATGNSKPGKINGGDTQNIYNYFLSENTVESFLTNSTVNSNNKNDLLQRANTGWVYSTEKNGEQYFIYLNTGVGSINNVSFSGLQAGDEMKEKGGKVIGRVLFITSTQYNNMASVVNPGSDFDTYVRTFCYTQAGMLLSPEKVTLSKEADNRLNIEVEAPAYPGEEVEYVAALYRKGVKEGEETRIGLSEITLGADAEAGPGDSFTFDAETCTFEISEKVINEGGELFVKVKAVQKGGGKESPEVDSNLVAVGNTLPEPRIRIELTRAENSMGNYRFCLDNLEDYEEYTDNPGYANLQVAVQMMNGTKISFKLNEKGVHADLRTESLEQLLVWVEEINVPPADKGMSSAQVSVPVYLPAPLPAISLKNSGKTWVEPSCTVTGSSLEDLRIAVTLEGKGGNVTTPTVYRAELMGTWKDENGNTYGNTVFQSSDLLATTSGVATAVFTDLPEYMVDASDLHVRVWYAESGLGPVYTYSKYLADDSEADGNSPNAAKILTGTLTETPDGGQYSYDWRYEYTPVWQGNTLADYRWTSQKPLFTFLPAPKLMELLAGSDTLEPTTDPDTGHLQYTFKWDENEYNPGNRYTVSLTGLVKDEDGNVTRRVSIVTNRELPAAGSGEPANFITLDAENWSYNEVELTVTRKGDAGKNEIGLTSSRAYGVKRRLSRPAQPGVNNPDINELNYEIEFPAITPEEGCEYYEIYVQPYNEDGMTLGESIMAAKVPVRNDAGEPNADENGIYRQMVNLEQVGENSKDCAGRRVLIYIKAHPAGDSALYVHSVDGVTYGLDVPDRLKKPEITWEKNWEYERDSAKTVEGFQGEGQEEADGLKVTVNAQNNSIPPGGSSYLTKAYVFDSEEAAKNAKAEIESGSITDIEGLLEVYPPLQEDTLVPAQMDTESADKYSHSLLGLSAEYAGKYVLFYARISSGQGNISSPWVCSDESSGIWRLPYVKLQTPEVTVANEGYDRDVTLIFNPDLQDTTAFKVKKETENQDGSGEEDEKEPSGEDASGDGEDGEKEPSEDAGDEDEKEPSEDTGDGNEKEPSEDTGDGNEKEPSEDTGDGNEKEPSEDTGDRNEKEPSEDAGDGDEKEPSEEGKSENGKDAPSVPSGAEIIKTRFTYGFAGNKAAGVMNLAATAGRSYGRTIFTRLSGRAGNAFTMRNETEVEDILPAEDREIRSDEDESLYYAGEDETPEIDVQADTPSAGKEESVWTADSTTLSWNSVRFADSSYITLTDKEQGTQEFKIKETVTDDGNGGTTASAAVFWKNENGDWEEITGNDGLYELSQYHKEIEGQYEKETGFKVPYKVDLTAGLKVEALEDNRFAYTLLLPDADSLTPKEEGGNSIESDELRFTQSVEICADVEENETSPGSDAYVRSDTYKVDF